jgi:hypothetical protein
MWHSLRSRNTLSPLRLNLAKLDFACHRQRHSTRLLFAQGMLWSQLLCTGRVSVAIRRLVHHSWYGPVGEVQLDRDRLFARDKHSTDRVLMSISIRSLPGRIDSNKQCFHNHFMYTCLLRATSARHLIPQMSKQCKAFPPLGPG